MKKTILAIALMAATGIAMADGRGNDKNSSDGSMMLQGQMQGQESVSSANAAGGAGGSSSSVTGDSSANIGDAANNNGNAQNITFNNAPDEIGRASDPEFIQTDNASTVEYKGTYTVNNVPSMVAPHLTTASETCMGSTSGSIAIAGFGASGGSTWTDDDCVQRLDARELRAMNMAGAAKERMCGTYDNYNAMARAGVPCTIRKDFEERLQAELEENQEVAALETTDDLVVSQNTTSDDMFSDYR